MMGSAEAYTEFIPAQQNILNMKLGARVVNVYRKKPVEAAHSVATVSTRVSPQAINQKSTVQSTLAT